MPTYLQLGIDFCLVVFGLHTGFWDQKGDVGKGVKDEENLGKGARSHPQYLDYSTFPLHIGTHTTPLFQGGGVGGPPPGFTKLQIETRSDLKRKPKSTRLRSSPTLSPSPLLQIPWNPSNI